MARGLACMIARWRNEGSEEAYWPPFIIVFKSLVKCPL